MQRTIQILITFIIFCQFTGCSSNSNSSWLALVPENSTFMMIPEDGTNVQDIFGEDYTPYLDDLTPTALQQLAELDMEAGNFLRVKALALYPTTSQRSNFLWITESPDARLKDWVTDYYEPFSQNNYEFSRFIIHKLSFNSSEFFAAEVSGNVIFSESSLVVEEALRSYTGQSPSIKLDEFPGHSTLVVNTPQLNQWMEQFASVTNRPSLVDKFSGSLPVSLKIVSEADSSNNFKLSGQIPLLEDERSALVDAFSFENAPITLDRHIASNAAAFAILRLPPVSVPIEPDIGYITPLDSLFMNNMDAYQSLANTLSSEFAFEAFAESGLLTTGEYLFMRKMNNPARFRDLMEQLTEQELVEKVDDSYQVSSSILGTLIGSELSRLRDFYLAFSNDVVVIAKRKGLAESVDSDRMRRRVIYYDDSYSDIRSQVPSELSGFAWARSSDFLRFLNPYLRSGNTAGGLLNKFDITAMTMTTNDNMVDFTLSTFTSQGSALPYEELWVIPLSDFELSGPPVLGDIAGSNANEIIFSTTDGRVFALATDGTTVMQTTTNGLEPAGSPQLYDWYGNGQEVVMLAAGSKIFAWNESGDLLPRFPLELGSQISAPILVQDVLRNGVPEIVAATEDRKVHVLDGRGENVRGWPQNTNATVLTQPVFELLDGEWSVWVFSENALHSWRRDGQPRAGFPQFVTPRLTGTPMIFDEQVLATGADGYLYSIGEQPLFTDSLATTISEDAISVRSLYVANTELSMASLNENVLLRDSTGFFREDLIATQSSNGSLFLYNKSGQLRFAESLGQPSSPTYAPQVLDINGDSNTDLIALADFGRLFAWEILTGERLFGLPTSGMTYPVIADINNDGSMELIAQTREGLRCWTINPVE